MRIMAIVTPALFGLALALATGCGSGCGHGNHQHPTGSSWDEAPDYQSSCTCAEGGEIECDSTAMTSGGVAYN